MPWQKKAAAESNASRLDQAVESDEDEDMFDADKGGADGAAAGQVVEADLASYQNITLSRSRLGRWCNEPFFKEAVLNCFVRLFIGENESGKRCYRLCRIVGVKTEKTQYTLPPVKNDKPVSCLYPGMTFVLIFPET